MSKENVEVVRRFDEATTARTSSPGFAPESNE
jgi:hypothetical protein